LTERLRERKAGRRGKTCQSTKYLAESVKGTRRLGEIENCGLGIADRE